VLVLLLLLLHGQHWRRPSERLVQLQCVQEQQLGLLGSLHSLGSNRRLTSSSRERQRLQGAGLTASRTGLM
jgi:hypothetical protein